MDKIDFLPIELVVGDTAYSDCITSYDKCKLPEILEYYAAKGCRVETLSDVM